MIPLRTDEMAAFLGLTPSGLRSVIHRHGIAPVGKDGKANLYDPQAIIDKAGAKDRRAA